MSVKISLNIEQIADILKQLSEDELEELDDLLERDIVKEVKRRYAEVKAGKKIPLEKAKCFKDLD